METSTAEISQEKEELNPYDLRGAVVEDRWDEVIKMYDAHKEARTIEINNSRGTALHVAANHGNEKVVRRLVEAVIKHEKATKPEDDDQVNALVLTNERGDTPLHLAASRGFKDICECIIGENQERENLISVKNNEGETPLFLAALSWQKQAFAYLWYVFQQLKDTIEQLKDTIEQVKDTIDDNRNLRILMREDGDTILHCAIRREFCDLALIIIRCYPKLRDIQNKQGFTPLKVLATRPSAFKSGSKLTWWKQIIYHCIEVDDLDVEKAMNSYLDKKVESGKKGAEMFPENYRICYEFFTELPHLAVTCGDIIIDKKPSYVEGEHKIKIQEKAETSNVPEMKGKESTVPENYAACNLLAKLAYMHTLGLSGVEINVIRNIKKKHRWGGQLLKAFMEKPYDSYMGSGGQPLEEEYDVGETDPFSAYINRKKDNEDKDKEPEDKKEKEPDAEEEIDIKETAFLAAARNGIVEIVTMILSKIPSALHDTTSDKKNVFLVAAMNKQPLVIKALLEQLSKEDRDNLIQGVDKEENTVLHLAATFTSSDKGWQIAGYALKMMWEIKWFQYIKDLVPDHFNFRNNKGGKTAGEIFKESHVELVEKSSEWLKDTAESCSVVAALIAGVSFATSSTIPGGTNEDTGKPALEGKPAFDIFAVASLIGLCFSVTALIMFLSILTSRKQAKDFRKDLPLKLLLGLSSLFVSIAAMFISFCSGHFFVLTDKTKQIIFPIYAATCLPVTFYAVAQFPLYIDLLKAILKKVPLPSDRGDDL